jgi:hypothetical protein
MDRDAFQRFQFLRNHVGMFTQRGDFGDVCHILVGMDFMTGGRFLDGFGDYLKRRFGVEGPWPWWKLVELAHGQQSTDAHRLNRLEFLFRELEAFYDDRRAADP